MSWYEDKSKKRLDFSKPIIASRNDIKYLLLPQIEKGKDYDVIGYNWFNVTSGSYNSCAFFKTAEEAIKCYRNTGCTIYNVDEVV